MSLRDWETWHRIFEGMTGVGTVLAVCLGVGLAVRADLRERAERKNSTARYALRGLTELLISWSSGDAGTKQRQARALLLRLRSDQATLVRVYFDQGPVDLDVARGRLALADGAVVARDDCTPEQMLAEVAENEEAL